MRALALLLVVLLLLPLAPARTPVIEDDAGSGRDAPDDIAAAMADPLVVPTNALLMGYTDWLLDAADVYAFDVEAGQRFLVDVAGPVGCIQVYRPDGAAQPHDAACSTAYASLGTLSIDADVGGRWYMEYSYLEPQVYRFSIGLDGAGPSPYVVPDVLGASAVADALPPVSPASESGEHVVVAVVDTGINPYHAFFAAPALADHPSTWLPGFPASVPSVALTLDAPSYADAVATDAATWDALDRGTLYTFPGTRVVGGISFSEYTELTDDATGRRPVLDEHGHGSHSAGLAAGANLPAAEGNVLIVMVEVSAGDFARGVAWAAQQPWIDAISLSAGSRANAPLSGDMLVASRLARDAGKPFFVASGNGASGTGVPPDHCSTYTSQFTGPSWVTRVGAADPANENPTWWHCVPVDFIARTNVGSADRASLSAASIATGTSAATPNAMGAYARLLLEAKRLGIAGDRAAVLAHLANASVPAQTAVGVGTEPSTSATAPFDQGFGLVDGDALARALATLPTGTPTPRPELDAWWSADRAIREALWGEGGALSGGASVEQDDAGSGRDAPSTLTDEVRIQPGVAYRGLLLGIEVDDSDVYAFDVAAGDAIQTLSRGNLHCSYLYDPLGAERAFGCALSPALDSVIDFVADMPGTWHLEVSYLEPESYGFGVGLNAPAPDPGFA